MMIKNFLLLLLSGITLQFALAQKANPSGDQKNSGAIAASEYYFETNPFFADEFNYTGLPDSTRWSYDVGGSGWGNNEWQYYTNQLKNASVADGLLTITALKEDMDGRNYTSARIVTKNKGDLLYGRVEVRAKIPAGIGTWPAIWMLPTDWKYGDWPKSGEIDIMEHVGYDQDVIHFSTHCEAYYHWLNNQKTAVKKIENSTTGFHIYRVDWTPDEILGFIDNELIFSNKNENSGHKAWPFDQRFHLILNVAVGGNWGAVKGVDEKAFPASMQVDYVRFYRLSVRP